MKRTRVSELQTPRGRFFFWLGLLVLPVFWVWWMRPVYFSRNQRIAGYLWTAFYIGLMIAFRGPIGLRIDALKIGYPLVALQVGLGLWLWLAFRLFGFAQVVLLFIVSTDLIAIIAGLPGPAVTDLSPKIMVFPLIPAILHLFVNPVRRWIR